MPGVPKHQAQLVSGLAKYPLTRRFQTGRSTRRNDREICTGTDRLYNWARKHGVKTAWGTDLLCEPVLAGRKAKW
jgi:imidazolonepropionase-like amidohydrolase